MKYEYRTVHIGDQTLSYAVHHNHLVRHQLEHGWKIHSIVGPDWRTVLFEREAR